MLYVINIRVHKFVYKYNFDQMAIKYMFLIDFLWI